MTLLLFLLFVAGVVTLTLYGAWRLDRYEDELDRPYDQERRRD